MSDVTLSPTLSDSEKKDVERELAFSEKIMSFFLSAIFVFLMKNLFLINSSVFHFVLPTGSTLCLDPLSVSSQGCHLNLTVLF